MANCQGICTPPVDLAGRPGDKDLLLTKLLNSIEWQGTPVYVGLTDEEYERLVGQPPPQEA